MQLEKPFFVKIKRNYLKSILKSIFCILFSILKNSESFTFSDYIFL